MQEKLANLPLPQKNKTWNKILNCSTNTGEVTLFYWLCGPPAFRLAFPLPLTSSASSLSFLLSYFKQHPGRKPFLFLSLRFVFCSLRSG